MSGHVVVLTHIPPSDFSLLQYIDEKYADVGVLAAGAIWGRVPDFFGNGYYWRLFFEFLYTSYMF